MARSTSRFRLAVTLAALAAACGDGDLTLPNEGEPAALEIFRGDDQNGTVGEALADSLVVEVTDRFGGPVGGVSVSWSAESGGSVDPAETLTGADGRAATQRILGPQPTNYFTIARVEGLPDLVFTSTGLAARLVFTSEIPALASSGVPLSPQPSLRLEDVDGSPIAQEGVSVMVAISSGAGELTGATSATSDAEGNVQFTDLAISGEPGTRRLIFAADGFAPATTPPIALGAGVPSSIEPAGGDDQTATVGEPVPIAPSVVLRDADGNPLSGIPVTFTVTSGGGTVSGNTPVTGSDGVATVGQWKLGPIIGENTLSAAVAGQDLSGSPVVFSATGTAGGVSAEKSTVAAAPAGISVSTGASASTITVSARDQFDNPVPGVEVSLAVTGTGTSLVQPSGPTDANGVATGSVSSTAIGSLTVSATAGGVTLQQTATVTVSAGEPVAANSSATVPNGTAGQTTAIQVLLRDAFGNPAAGRAGSIAVSITGANTVGAPAVSDQGGGNYTVSYDPVVAGSDLVDVRVGGTPVAGSPFTSVVVPGPVSAGASTAGVTWTFFTVDVVVTARDAQGNPVGVGGATVVVTPQGFSPVTATDQGNGTYVASITVFSFPPVTITLNDLPIQGSPFTP